MREEKMNIKAFMIFVAIIATAYGLGFLLVPGHLVRLYGVATGPAVILGYRFFGVALLAIGLIFWFAKESLDWTALRALLLGGAVSDAAGIVVAIWGSSTGIMNALGWSVVLIYVVLLAGSIYFLQLGSRQPAMTP